MKWWPQKWITGALSSTHLTTAVRTGGPGKDGVSVLVIPTDLPGYSARKIDNSGLNAGGRFDSDLKLTGAPLTTCCRSASAWVDFEDVHVPVENLIGKENEGFKVLMGSKYLNHQPPLDEHLSLNDNVQTSTRSASSWPST